MKRILLLVVVLLALLIAPLTFARPQNCSSCSSGAQEAGDRAFNALRDAGETDQLILTCAAYMAKREYVSSNCPGCQGIIVEDWNPCMQ